VLRTRITADYWRPILTGVLVLLLPLALLQGRDPGRPAESAIVTSLPAGCNLFTDPDTAGAVLLLRPDVKVWIDMRTEVYGSSAYGDTRRRLFAPEAVRIPAGATCALVPPSRRSVSSDGASSPRWVRVKTANDLTLWVPA
jgi:hypothetical protein